MFELKYNITDGDMKAVNTKIMIFYFALYLAVAIIGLAIGVVAIVLRPQTLMLVLGIILLILGAVLLVCSLLLLIAPKNFVASAVKPSDDTHVVTVDDKAISVDSDTVIPLEQVSKVKLQSGMLLLTVGKNTVLIVKDAITSGQSLDELRAHFASFRGAVPTAVSQPIDQGDAKEGESVKGDSEDDNKTADVKETNDVNDAQ